MQFNSASPEHASESTIEKNQSKSLEVMTTGKYAGLTEEESKQYRFIQREIDSLDNAAHSLAKLVRGRDRRLPAGLKSEEVKAVFKADEVEIENLAKINELNKILKSFYDERKVYDDKMEAFISKKREETSQQVLAKIDAIEKELSDEWWGAKQIKKIVPKTAEQEIAEKIAQLRAKNREKRENIAQQGQIGGDTQQM